jgi:hypothetical protein
MPSELPQADANCAVAAQYLDRSFFNADEYKNRAHRVGWYEANNGSRCLTRVAIPGDYGDCGD